MTFCYYNRDGLGKNLPPPQKKKKKKTLKCQEKKPKLINFFGSIDHYFAITWNTYNPSKACNSLHITH